MEILTYKFELNKHLYSIKQFLLMGQGEFIQILMEILIPELNKPASKIYRHNLLGFLE